MPSQRRTVLPPVLPVFGLLVFGLLVFGLLLMAPVARAAPSDAVISGGRMQVLLPSRPAAGYFTLENRGDGPMVLNGASAPDCQSLMLHRSSTEGGMSTMAMVAAVPVPPHGSIRFAPGGYHLMCVEPTGILLTRQGNETVTLHFVGGGSVSAPFAIQGVGPRAADR